MILGACVDTINHFGGMGAQGHIYITISNSGAVASIPEQNGGSKSYM